MIETDGCKLLWMCSSLLALVKVMKFQTTKAYSNFDLINPLSAIVCAKGYAVECQAF
jgi:hypothetical protein